MALIVLGFVLSTSGCLATFGEDSPSGPDCKFNTEIVSPETAYPVENYTYENMSSSAQRAFDVARERGGYSTKNSSIDSPEFLYGGTATSYNVTYRGETYTVMTYSGEGCEIE